MGVNSLLATMASAWLWDKYGKEITDKALGTLKEQWGKFKWRAAAECYQVSMKEKHSTMRVFAKKQSVPLNDYYIDLFVLDKPIAFRRYGIEQLLTYFKKFGNFQSPDKRSSALRIASQYDRLFILGKPGAGKTTLLKHLTTLATENKINRIPLFVSLSDWANTDKDLLQYIVGEFEMCGFPDAKSFILAVLRNGDAMILFDGLDEVSEKGGKRDRMLHDIDNFMFRNRSESQQDNKFFITCRTATNSYIFEREPFVYVEVADLVPEQVFAFARKWFSHNPPKGELFWEEIKKDEHHNLLELTQNPLLLGLLCLSFDEKSRFPASREQLYKDAIDTHLTQWDESKGIKRDEIYHALNLKAKRHLLAHLAYTFFEEDQIFFSLRTITQEIANFLTPVTSFFEIDPDVVVKSIESQHGLLIERAQGIYSFSHLTFQEYFTAQYIINAIISKLPIPKTSKFWQSYSLSERSDYDLDSTKKSWQHFLDFHITDSHWHEIIRIIACLLTSRDANHFFYAFIDSLNDILATDERICNITKEYSELGYSDRDISLLELAHELEFDDLSIALEQLEIPQVKKPLRYWGELSSILHKMKTNYRGIGNFLIRYENARACLRDYIRALILLLNCLQLSALSDQMAITKDLSKFPTSSSKELKKRYPLLDRETAPQKTPPPPNQVRDMNPNSGNAELTKRGVGLPKTQSTFTYILGNDLNYGSFSIDTPSGGHLGNFGIDAIATIDADESKKVTAFKIWLFENTNLKTDATILISSLNFLQPRDIEGELILATKDLQIDLDTNALHMVATVVDLEFTHSNKFRMNVFGRLTLEFAVWSK